MDPSSLSSLPTLTESDVRACISGLAFLEGSSVDLHLSQSEDIDLWEQAIVDGYLTLPYPKARNRLALILLWEMWCAAQGRLTLWYFPHPDPELSTVAVNLWTLGYHFDVKTWVSLKTTCRRLGLTPNKYQYNGVRSFQGSPLGDGWVDEIFSSVTRSVTGPPINLMDYRVVLNTYGLLSLLRTKSNEEYFSDSGHFRC